MKKLSLIFIILLSSFSAIFAVPKDQASLLVSVDTGQSVEPTFLFGFRTEGTENELEAIKLVRTGAIDNPDGIMLTMNTADKPEIYWNFKSVYPCILSFYLGGSFSGSPWSVEIEKKADSINNTGIGNKHTIKSGDPEFVLVDHRNIYTSNGSWGITGISALLWKEGITMIPEGIIRQDMVLKMEVK